MSSAAPPALLVDEAVEIPHDVLHLVYTHLGVPDVARAAAVCKAWRDAARSPCMNEHFIN
jgi:hypothetical protein